MVRKFWLPFVMAILLCGLIEAGIYAVRQPDFWDKTAWLQHDPYRGELFDRLVVSEKLKQLLPEKPDIISVGDSSGFFSLQPNIINRYLHGLKYASLSTGANQAFDGYKAIAEFALKRQPSIKYVVLNMYPNLLPSGEVFRKADLALIEYENLAGLHSEIMPPSASLSHYMKSLFFYWHDVTALPPSSHEVFFEMRDTIAGTLGWVAEHDVPFDRVLQTTPFFPDHEGRSGTLFGLFEPSPIVSTLSDFAAMCRRYHVKLMIMFNPMAWQTITSNEDLFTAEKRLEEFQLLNPDVTFLTDRLITPWDPAKFGMYNHISRAYVHEGSARMGAALEKALYDPASLPPFKAGWTPRKFPVPTDITPVGKADDAQINAALAYYLFTASLHGQYWNAISSRVHEIVWANQPFRWMIEDTETRVKQLAAKKIELIYDSSQIKGDIVTLKNGYYCGNSKDVTWVHLSGVMQFVYSSSVQGAVEPVEWPASSNIIIPIIQENGHYVFDGYCPATQLPPEPKA